MTESASFPLPTLGPEIARWTAELAHGRAFQLVRGFPVDELDPDETRAAFLGLGSHLGVPVGQNRSGEILTDIRDERLPAEEPHVRRYRTRLRQDFHTDGADIVGLLCLHTALRGGESRIASAGAVYNALLGSWPDLLEVLHRPFHWDRQGEEAPGEQPWFELPPLSEVDGTPRFFYLGWYIRDAQRHPEVPRLTDEQLDAAARGIVLQKATVFDGKPVTLPAPSAAPVALNGTATDLAPGSQRPLVGAAFYALQVRISPP